VTGPDATAACGCCDGLRAATPIQITNPPGLDSLAYRTGTHASFKTSMLAALSRGSAALADFLTRHGAASPVQAAAEASAALLGLQRRDDDDFAVALLDGWATAADVLTFYTERIANESFLRTATERRSLLELARQIGYELRPGIAAATSLVFTLDPSVGAPTKTIIPVGTAVQSVPDPGQQPVTFETTELIEARPAWNAIQPRQWKRHPLPYTAPSGDTEIVLLGTVNDIAVGDGIVFKSDAGPVRFGTVAKVTFLPVQPPDGPPQTGPRRTVLGLNLLADPDSRSGASFPAVPFKEAPLGTLAQSYLGQVKTAADLEAEAVAGGFSVQDLFDNFSAAPALPPFVLAFRVRAATFGHNAPALKTLPAALRVGEWAPKPAGTNAVSDVQFFAGVYSGPTEATWADGLLSQFDGAGFTAGDVHLDVPYPSIAAGGTVVLRDGATWAVYGVSNVADISLSVFSLNGRSTRLTLDSTSGLGKFSIRGTAVYAASRWLPLAQVPEDEPVAADTNIELDGWVEGLVSGRSVAVSGISATTLGLARNDVRALRSVEHRLNRPGGDAATAPWGTKITLIRPLSDAYLRADANLAPSCLINANVAAATHGETRHEIMGSGDRSIPFQSFMLRQPPLTYTSASNAQGAQSTLGVFVGGVQWQETPSFFGSSPGDRVFICRLADDGTPTIEFGDGTAGARLPTGPENLEAHYRKGAGASGLVRAGQLTMLISRPPGVQQVTNPLKGIGGDDPETLQAARANAPLAVRALDRVVSMQDYEDFARAFSGIAKALAVWSRTGNGRGVFITVAGPQGAAVDDGDPVHDNLVAAIRALGDPNVPFRVASYQPRTFRLTVNLKIDPAHPADAVQAAVESALRSTFGFSARNLGQPVAASEVIATIQAVDGIVALGIAEFYRSGTSAGLPAGDMLTAAVPAGGADDDAPPAELLTLDPAPVQFGTLR
jgi:hypothetical protein